jgi:hypothetical protein
MAVMSYTLMFVLIILKMINSDIFKHTIIHNYLEPLNSEENSSSEAVGLNINNSLESIKSTKKQSLINISSGSKDNECINTNKIKISKAFYLFRRIMCCKRSKEWQAYRLLLDKARKFFDIYIYFEMVQDYRKIVENYSELITLNDKTNNDMYTIQGLEKVIFERVERRNKFKSGEHDVQCINNN